MEAPTEAALFGASLLASFALFALHGRGLPDSAPWTFEWRRRAVGVWSHAALFGANVWVLWYDEAVLRPAEGRDIVTAYSPVSHAAFLVAAAVYAFDTGALLWHPRKSGRTKAVWTVHHLGSLFFLALITRVRMGSFPAACFMVSSATHVTCNLRWFVQTAGGRKNTPADKALGVLNAALFFLVAVAPIPFMFWRVSEAKGVPLAELLLSGDFRHIHRKCVAGTLAIYVPHVLLFFRIAAKEAARLGRPSFVPKRARGRAKEE